ncbi:MAG: endonuclease/exonuclease/phosphatase family protein [Woeseiaceae bacterium]
MLVEIASGSVTGPNQRFGSDPVAEVFITAASGRTFREPGIEFPGLAGLPVWDGNPEVFELDPDKLGLPNQAIPAGSSFSAIGILGFEFGDYELWPTSLDVDSGDFPTSVRDNHWLEATVGSLNLFRLFDDVDDPPSVNGAGETIDDFVVSTDEYQRRLTKFASYIVDGMGTPDILGVQEVESLKVLEDLAAAIDALNPHARYEAYLVDGNDVGGIDVGFLVRKWRVWVWSVEQLGAEETYVNPNDGSLDILHDRPPLLLKGWAGLLPINVMVVHNRSLSGIDTERVQVKRLAQALSIAEKVQDIQSARNPRDRNLVVLGDFNAFQFSDGYVDALGHIRGDFDAAESLLSGEDLVDPDLMNQLMSLPADEQYSFIFQGNAQALDHALTSRSLDFRVRGADAAVDLVNDGATALRASDHDGLVLYIYTFPGKVWKPWW